MNSNELTGRTTLQIERSPPGATYVWPNANFNYPVRLSRQLNRTDLKFVPASWIRRESFAGRRSLDIAIDHHVRLSSEQLELLRTQEGLGRIKVHRFTET
jgi:hypothetical protein